MASQVTNSEWLAWVASLMGGVSRQACASAYPPDRFYCLLDDLPLHLIPQEVFSSLRSPRAHREELHLNPSCRVLRGGDVPAELAACQELLSQFAIQGKIAWVGQPEAGRVSPFWIGPELAQGLEGVGSVGPWGASLSEADANLLVTAGILACPEKVEKTSQMWRGQVARSAEMFKQRGYAPLRNLMHPFHVAALRRYYRHMIRTGKTYLGDEQSARRYVAHNESVARFFHHQIVNTVSAIVGEPVKPSYVYLASYLSGAELEKHTDREQCEFSVTLCLDFSPEPARETPWPIRLETPRGEVQVYQGLGDGLVYRGTRIPHYRYRLGEGQTSTSIFFHYVPLDFSGALN